VNSAETAEPIDLPFWRWTRVGEGSISLIVFAGWRQSAQIQSYLTDGANVTDDTTVSCAKTAEQIDLPFGLWTRVSR